MNLEPLPSSASLSSLIQWTTIVARLWRLDAIWGIFAGYFQFCGTQATSGQALETGAIDVGVARGALPVVAGLGVRQASRFDEKTDGAHPKAHPAYARHHRAGRPMSYQSANGYHLGGGNALAAGNSIVDLALFVEYLPNSRVSFRLHLKTVS